MMSFVQWLKAAAVAVAMVWSPLPASAGFPAGKCSEHVCSATPYTMRWTNTGSAGGASGDSGLMCFQVDWNPACSSTKGCCELFAQRFNKVVIAAPAACKPAFKFVTVNGVMKGGGVYYDTFDDNANGELRITNLNMNASTAVGTTFCIKASSPCSTAAQFCDDGTGRCRYAVYDVVRHECCPTCVMQTLSTNPQAPMLLTAPPPPPKQRTPPPPSSRPSMPITPSRPPPTEPAADYGSAPPPPPKQKETMTCECTCETTGGN